MKIWHLNAQDYIGGAARAAFRLHQALLLENVDSSMHVNKSTTGDHTVYSPNSPLFKISNQLKSQLIKIINDLAKFAPNTPTSLALFPSNWPKLINGSDLDVVHLHWICGEMMSIEDIRKIKKTITWTLHDMWTFSGAEHINYGKRWQEGYSSSNGSPSDSGLDLNRWTWARKRRAWNKPFQLITPSHWLESCVKQSALFSDWPVTTIHNAIDCDKWKPMEKSTCKQILGLPTDKHILAFGAMDGKNTYHKGFDLLTECLKKLRGQIHDLELVVFGKNKPKDPIDFGFPVHYLGHIFDDISLAIIYNAADALIIPSRIDNLPNTGVEAMACGTPVIAFDTCGLPDIVSHQETGWLANAFDTEDLAKGIQWVLEDESRNRSLGRTARLSAVEKYSYPVVAAQYMELYHAVLKSQ